MSIETRLSGLTGMIWTELRVGRLVSPMFRLGHFNIPLLFPPCFVLGLDHFLFLCLAEVNRDVCLENPSTFLKHTCRLTKVFALLLLSGFVAIASL